MEELAGVGVRGGKRAAGGEVVAHVTRVQVGIVCKCVDCFSTKMRVCVCVHVCVYVRLSVNVFVTQRVALYVWVRITAVLALKHEWVCRFTHVWLCTFTHASVCGLRSSTHGCVCASTCGRF